MLPARELNTYPYA